MINYKPNVTDEYLIKAIEALDSGEPLPYVGKVRQSIHAKMPKKLYRSLVESAYAMAEAGDREVAEWILREMTVRNIDVIRREFQALRNSGLLKQYYGKPCASCGCSANTVDHIKPISKGGTNDPSNLQPMCLTCNSKKNAKT